MNPFISDRVIAVNPDDDRIRGGNRFLPKTKDFVMEVDYTKSFHNLVSAAGNCIINGNEVLPGMFYLRAQPKQKVQVSFEVVMVNTGPIPSEVILNKCNNAGLRPACIIELLTFASKMRCGVGQYPLIALGSSTKEFLEKEELLKPWYKKIIPNILLEILREKPEPTQFPYIHGHDRNTLRLGNGQTSWRTISLYLTVNVKREGDEKLVELPIDMAEYNAITPMTELTKEELENTVPLGTKYKALDGHIVELVEGKKMFAHQWGAGLSVPARGWRHYRPYFVEKTAKAGK